MLNPLCFNLKNIFKLKLVKNKNYFNKIIMNIKKNGYDFFGNLKISNYGKNEDISVDEWKDKYLVSELTNWMLLNDSIKCGTNDKICLCGNVLKRTVVITTKE